MEASIEYRSVIFKYLEGAVFTDMGNIWLRKDPSGTLTGSSFQWNRILDDLAIGAGVGARLNFNFFIIRFDGAVKIRDPGLPDGRQWVYNYQKFAIGDITLNFAIGYPF
jgi:outer membrane protein assembly factor BamA